MPDGKRRLPLYTEPSEFDDKEVLALHFNKPLFFTVDCFTDHSEDKSAVKYHFQGLKALNQGYWSADTKERQQHFQTAFGYFHLAHNFDKQYFCTREALSHVAGLIGLDSIEEGEKYANNLESIPTVNLGFENENKKSDSHYVCHLMHQGFYNASDLKRLEDSFKEGRK